MGSGTTIGEAHKLGFTALGRDINPVACQSVRVSLGPLDRDALMQAFGQLSAGVGERFGHFTRLRTPKDTFATPSIFFGSRRFPVLPACERGFVPVLHLRAQRLSGPKTGSRVVCPKCGGIFSADVKDSRARVRTADTISICTQARPAAHRRLARMPARLPHRQNRQGHWSSTSAPAVCQACPQQFGREALLAGHPQR